MGILQTYLFNNEDNFNQTNTEIVGSVAKLSLIPNPGQLFSQDFSSDAGFTYDSDEVEFVGGVLRQKDQKFNPTYGSTGGLATSPGTVTKNSGSDLWGDAGTVSNETIASKGWIQFKPGFTDKAFLMGLSSTNETLSYADLEFGIYCGLDNSVRVFESGVDIGIFFASYSITDVFRVEVSGGVVVYKKNGTTFYTSLATPSFPLFMDCSFYSNGGSATDIEMLTGFQYIGSKVDGPNFTYSGVGSVLSLDDGTVSETGSPRYIIGLKYWNGSAWVVSNGTYAQANSFATVIANLTAFVASGGVLPWSVLFPDSDTQSSIDEFEVEVTGEKYSPTGYIEPVMGINVQSLIDYSHSAEETMDAYVRVILKIDGALKYWNGSAWVTSNGSEAQSNTMSQVASNLDELEFGSNSTVFIRWLLLTSSNVETPELSESTVEYDFGAIEVELEKCLIYGYYKDISDNPVAGATVKFSLSREKGVYQEANKNIIEASVSATTDSNGYFEAELVRTSEYSNGGTYKIEITKKDGGLNTSKKNSSADLTFQVPDADMKDITDLLPG